ncbi:MAG TPA: MauE/DoxX family redox-associated membrane protein [Elusimicrobiales bacterium]|nr:MauE/DoxX family redox-associated membrane protein [Elusimicrobiales bacterium]
MKKNEPVKAPPLTSLELLGFAGRLAAGGVLAYAGFLKLASPAEEFAYAIETYKIVPGGLALFAARTVPWFELYLGALLIAGLYTRITSLAAGALLLFFELLLAQAWLRGLPVTNCGCFGSSGGNSLQFEFMLNVIWLFAALLAWRFGSRLSLDAVFTEN